LQMEFSHFLLAAAELVLVRSWDIPKCQHQWTKTFYYNFLRALYIAGDRTMYFQYVPPFHSSCVCGGAACSWSGLTSCNLSNWRCNEICYCFQSVLGW
jgi:hypothetical protein